MQRPACPKYTLPHSQGTQYAPRFLNLKPKETVNRLRRELRRYDVPGQNSTHATERRADSVAGPMSIMFTVDVNTKKQKTAVLFRLQTELYVLVETIHVVNEIVRLAWPIRPNDECHTWKPSEKLVGRPIKSHLFKVLKEEAVNDKNSSQPTATPSVYSQNRLLKLKKEYNTWHQSLRVSSSKCLFRRRKAAPVGTLLKNETSKLRKFQHGTL